MQQLAEIVQFVAFAGGLILMISSNARFLRRTRHDIQDEDSRRRKDYAAHGLKVAFVRIAAIMIIMGITVRYADLKVFWGVLFFIYLIGFVGTSLLMTERLPKQLPEMPRERVDREFKVKWWNLASQFILLMIWLYSWRHLYY